MRLPDLRLFLVGLSPITLIACVDTEAATAPPTSTAPVIGVDLGNSSRVPQIAGLAGEGEGYGRTESGMTLAQQGSMLGMGHEPGMQMDRGSISGMSHASMGEMPMDHGSMAGMDHRPTSGMPMDHGAMPGRHAPTHEMQMAHSGHAHAQGTGTVNSVDVAAHKLNISHGPIPTIGWPAMTMDFAVAPSVDLHAIQPGNRINFTIEQGGYGMYVIQSITPAGGARK
jgi:Cu(I)/Ag(I) efflux system protein CusF